MPMCEIELDQHSSRNPELIRLFDRYKIYPYIQKYALIHEDTNDQKISNNLI